MGIISRIKKVYRKVDAITGGRLPGGVSSKPTYKVTIPTNAVRGGSTGGGTTGGVSSGGGVSYSGGGSGGYSYVDPVTKKGYEVSPMGIRTEVMPQKPTTSSISTQQTLRKQELRRYSAAKTFEEKTKIAQEINKEREVATEQRRIAEERRRILSSGGATTTKTYKDVDTGHKVEHIITKGKGSERIFTTKDLVTGETKVRTYAPPKGGGGARQTGGIYFKPIKPEVESVKETKITYGEVQPVTTSFLSRVLDVPSKAIEKVTGKKPREAFRFITGSQEKDVTKPVSLLEGATEITQVPIRAVSIVGAVT